MRTRNRKSIEVILKCRFDVPIVLEIQEKEMDNAINMIQGKKYLEALLNSIQRGRFTKMEEN